MGFIDIHCHILPGIDDGPDLISESIEMARMAKEDGITHICATPHIMDGVYDNRKEGIAEAVNRLREQITVPLEIVEGADVRITPHILSGVEEGIIPTLSKSRYILLELPSYSLPLHLENLFFALRSKGIKPIISHPERHLILLRDLRKVQTLRESGCLIQITAMSITGGFGKEIRKSALSMIGKGVVDFVATDAHDTKRRPPVISKAYNEVSKAFGERIADSLFKENPLKVLENSPF